MRYTPPRILIALGWYDHRLQLGIQRYARERRWHVTLAVYRENIIPWGVDCDGVLAWLGANDELADFVACLRKPTVDFSFRRPQLQVARVLEDTAGTARLVADHLLARGVRHFLFYSDAENWVYDERGTGFQHALGLAGHEVRWLRWHKSAAHCSGRSAWKIKRRWLMQELRRAEKPVGIFAAYDDLAHEALEACEALGIEVPGEVAIVGAGDSLLAVNSMSTPISSVDTNFELLGYRGAEVLDGLIHNRPAPSYPIRIPPADLIVRKSSDLFAVSHPGIARSLRFLSDNCHEPIRVDHLARAASMSLRAFHETFLKCMGRRPGAEIRRARVEHARRLLKETPDKLSVIASKCGFRGSNSLSVAFKKTTGMSPSTYRTTRVPSNTVQVGKRGASNGRLTRSATVPRQQAPR